MELSPTYWLEQSIAALPAALWMFIGVGLPWALAVLPRRDWHNRALTACVTLMLGPALVTAWMFIPGSLAAAQDGGTSPYNFGVIVMGTIIIAVIGTIIAWRKWRHSETDALKISHPLAVDEKLIIGLIIIALILRCLTTAYWPFTSYDPIWVYGYEGRLYTLLEQIPQHIGYYPQFLPLQYSYMQLAVGGIDDHAARAVLPFLHVGSILVVYVLGSRIFNRRTGIFAAGLWALYPHVADWAHVGDLEIPVTFLLTGAAAFLLVAWTTDETRYRRRYALIAGLFLGTALWTKPTAGALVWGVILLAAAELVRLRGDWRMWWRKFEATAIMGLATIPLGGLWYVRNITLGHDAIDLPPAFWLTQAERSGREFGWPLLALIVLIGYLYLGRKSRPNLITRLIGLALVLAGLLPSIVPPLLWRWFPEQFEPLRFNAPVNAGELQSSYITPLEWALLGAGIVLLIWTFWRYGQEHFTDNTWAVTRRIAWVGLLALPYFLTWFYSYSYHYRLSFPIVPLMLMPTAVILAHWIKSENLVQWRSAVRVTYLLIIVVMSIPGVVNTLYRIGEGWDWLWTDVYVNDTEKYASQHPSLLFVVGDLITYADSHENDPVVIAPGAQLLPFFFPTYDIDITSVPTRIEELDGATHYVYSQHAQWRYEEAGIEWTENQIVAGLGRVDLFQPRATHDDGNFFYENYELNIGYRLVSPTDLNISNRADADIRLGDSIRYVGSNVHYTIFIDRERILVEFFWQVIAPIDDDYMVYIHLVDEAGTVFASWDGPVDVVTRHGMNYYYTTQVWEPGEIIIDRRYLQLDDPDSVPDGNNYRVVVGMYRLSDDERLSVTINGAAAGDIIMLETVYSKR